MRSLLKSGITIGLIVFFWTCQTNTEVNEGSLRIISLSPHITEIIYALQADTLLVAVTDFCRYPPAAQYKEHIGGLVDPNIEKMLSLKPTHLFGVPAHNELNNKIREFGLRVHMYPNETWQDLLATIDSISQQIGYAGRGQDLILKMKASLDSVKLRADIRKPEVLLLIGHEKGSLRNATVAGPNTFIDEMLNIAGGKNIYDDLEMRYGTVNIESMLARQPELIIDLQMGDERKTERLNMDETWTALGNTPALKHKNIYSIAGNHTLIPGPRMLWLAEDFRAVIDSVGIRD